MLPLLDTGIVYIGVVATNLKQKRVSAVFTAPYPSMVPVGAEIWYLIKF